MKEIISIYLLFSTCAANAVVAPSIALPPDFLSAKFAEKNLDEIVGATYIQQSSDCDSVRFKEYFFTTKMDNTDYYFNKSPIKLWQCLLMNGDLESYGLGYDPSVADEKPANQVVRYDEKNDTWKIVNRKSYHKNNKPLQLFNVTYPNAKGYMVVDENINKYDIQNGITQKKEVKFCLIDDSKKNYALCGHGDLLEKIDGKEVDLTAYFLKSLESMTLSNK